MDSSEKVLMSSGWAEDLGPPAPDSPACLWKGEARDTDDITAAGHHTAYVFKLAHTHTHTHTHIVSVPAAVRWWDWTA